MSSLFSKSNTRISTALATLIIAGGCAVGPNFKKPDAPNVSGYTPHPLVSPTAATKVAGGQAQSFVEGADIPGDWWKLLHSEALNNLISQALTNNPDLKSAQAALAQAHETMLAGRGAYWPSASGGFSATRSKTSRQISPTPANNALFFSVYTPQVSVSYVPDVFGLNRRTVESLKAQQNAARFALIATHVTLSANVVSAAIQEASLREQIAVTRQLIELNSHMLGVLRDQSTNGYASQLDVAAQESQLAQINATLPPLEKQLAQQRDLLAVLAGRFPSEFLPEKFSLANLQLPVELPVSLPSQLVEQRPDVRQAEENLHAASAQVGIAVANRLPNITLTADAGTMATEVGKIFAGGSGFWDLGASLTQPIFQGGTLLHNERAARAAYDQAAQQYRSTVLTAFQNVADTLSALQTDANALKTAAAAANAAQVTLNLTRQQSEAGYSSYLSLLTAEQAYQQTRLNLVQAQADRFADTAALFQALGGGWWHRPELTTTSHEK
jgi:NodT family efflux transporter outer membrane factor (OMF) lipoprotein